MCCIGPVELLYKRIEDMIRMKIRCACLSLSLLALSSTLHLSASKMEWHSFDRVHLITCFRFNRICDHIALIEYACGDVYIYNMFIVYTQ